MIIEHSIIGEVYLVVVTKYMDVLETAHTDPEDTEVADTTDTMIRLLLMITRNCMKTSNTF